MSDGVQRVLRVGRNVADLSRAVDFYCEALDFRIVEETRNAPPAWARMPEMENVAMCGARLRLGGQEIELTAFDPPGAPYPADSTSCDLWFQHCAVVVDDMDAAYQRVMRHGAMAITRDGPQTLPPSTGGVTAFKFRDPDGHPLELIAFPPGVGDPRWQAAQRTGPTLGIDHTAISVADAECSTAFYESLGFRVAATAVNRGIEQARLDALPDPRVDVIALWPAGTHTPHIELLCYRQPRGRISPPSEVRDIAADRIVLQVGSPRELLDHLRGAGIAACVGDDARAALLRDPDGHLLLLDSA